MDISVEGIVTGVIVGAIMEIGGAVSTYLAASSDLQSCTASWSSLDPLTGSSTSV